MDGRHYGRAARLPQFEGALDVGGKEYILDRDLIGPILGNDQGKAVEYPLQPPGKIRCLIGEYSAVIHVDQLT